MKRFLTLALAIASAGFIAVDTASAIDTYVVGDYANGIGNSRHNLGSLGEHITTTGYGSTEICMFCHTPHHGEPLMMIWNRATHALTSFTAYGPTLGGSSIANTDIGAATLACLSCHDGVTTFDNLINAPGSGGFISGGSDRGWTFYDAAVPGVVSDFMTSSRLNIGLNLTNDHPVSVVYMADRAGLRPTDTVISDIDLTADLAASTAAFDNGNLLKNLWAVKGEIVAGETIAALLRDNKVECTSCHDPHFNNKSWNEIDATYSTEASLQEPESNGLFLRRVGGNSGSGVCRTCHNK